MTQATAARDNLTREEADARASRVSNCSYTLRLDLGEKQPSYRGRLTIRFDDSGSGDLQLDHRGTSVESLTVNGRDFKPEFGDYRLRLPGDALQGSNTVEIVYENELRPRRRRLPPVHRPRRRRGVPLLQLRAVRGPPPLPLLRPARHQGHLRVLRRCPGRLRGDRQRRRRLRGIATGDGRRLPHLREDAGRSAPTSSRVVAGPLPPLALRCTATSRSASSAASRWCEHLDTDELFDDHPPGPRLLRRLLRRPLPLRQIRPALRARVQRRRDGERRPPSPTTSTWSSATRRPRTSGATGPK